MGGTIHCLRSCLALVLAAVATCYPRQFYIDNLLGDDILPGTTTDSPWKSFGNLRKVRLQPGDTVSICRGRTWDPDSIRVWWSGAEGNPIVIQSYGDPFAAKPMIRNAGTVISIWRARFIEISGIHLSGSEGNCLSMDDSSGNLSVNGVEMSNCGVGLRLAGANIKAKGNVIRDLKMVRNTFGPVGSPEANDDYGALAIMLSGVRNCLIEQNWVANARMPSYDYGFDGGVVEIARSVQGCEIRNNYSFNTDGFIEMGGHEGDTIKDVRVHHNIALESGSFSFIHGPDIRDKFGVEVKDVFIDHNTAITNSRAVSYFVGIGGLPRFGDATIRNNIFVADTIRKLFFGDSLLRRERNLLWANRIVSDSNIDSESMEIFAQPVFSSTEPNTFSLVAASPGYHQGAYTEYSHDFWLNTIPTLRSGVRPDIGAVQSREKEQNPKGARLINYPGGFEIMPPEATEEPFEVSLFSHNGKLLERRFVRNRFGVAFTGLQRGRYIVKLRQNGKAYTVISFVP